VRVSNELGAGNSKSASFSVVVVTVISFIICAIIALVVLALRDVISYVFTDGEEVAAAVSDLSPLLALAIVLNGVQPVLSGIIIFHLIFDFCKILFCFRLLPLMQKVSNEIITFHNGLF
jgi:multidrug resistance protein, MATE family